MTTSGDQNVETNKPLEITILWNGGWDDLLVDPNQVRTMTDDELELVRLNPVWPIWSDSDGDWLRVYYSRKLQRDFGLGPNTQVIRVLKTLASGD